MKAAVQPGTNYYRAFAIASKVVQRTIIKIHISQKKKKKKLYIGA
jgi:hypothetical protein